MLFSDPRLGLGVILSALAITANAATQHFDAAYGIPGFNLTCVDSDTLKICAVYPSAYPGFLGCSNEGNIASLNSPSPFPSSCASGCSCTLDPAPSPIESSPVGVPVRSFTKFPVPVQTITNEPVQHVGIKCLGETYVTGSARTIQDYCDNDVGAYCLATNTKLIVIPQGKDPYDLCSSTKSGAGVTNSGCQCDPQAG